MEKVNIEGIRLSTILENNRLLAEFMGLKLPLSTYNYSAMICTNNGNYHKDWNWLMLVIDKIESLGFDSQIIRLGTNYQCFFFDTFIEYPKCDSRIKAVYNSCIEFVKWYNENRQ